MLLTYLSDDDDNNNDDPEDWDAVPGFTLSELKPEDDPEDVQLLPDDAVDDVESNDVLSFTFSASFSSNTFTTSSSGSLSVSLKYLSSLKVTVAESSSAPPSSSPLFLLSLLHDIK